jgi:hypothetical protein
VLNLIHESSGLGIENVIGWLNGWSQREGIDSN